jgi:hypothetical protein
MKSAVGFDAVQVRPAARRLKLRSDYLRLILTLRLDQLPEPVETEQEFQLERGFHG